jgi:putative transposase
VTTIFQADRETQRLGRVLPQYRRPFVPGGTFFFTVVTQDRQPILCHDPARPLLRSAIQQTRADRPFELLAMVLLDDHLHAIWELPPGDPVFSIRWAAIKAGFTRAWLLVHCHTSE